MVLFITAENLAGHRITRVQWLLLASSNIAVYLEQMYANMSCKQVDTKQCVSYI